MQEVEEPLPPPWEPDASLNDLRKRLAALQAAKEVADEMGKPLFVGEFGAPACNSDAAGAGAVAARATPCSD